MERLKVSIMNMLTLQRLSNHIYQMENPPKEQAPSLDHAAQWWFLDGQGRMKKLRALELEAIRFALRHADGCMTWAARNLGIGSRSTLYP